ncbi:MAG: hypothetical protein KAU95_03330, partial [Candidatus Aenigmarchaeota archaeon]|nr:hypothetical protein [Candidatus Aenigmarchaeota archaeon]
AFISNLSEGINNWSITCWENGIGVPNRSETRTLNVDQTAPSLTINSPSEGDYLNSTSITINLTATDTNLNYTNISITNSTGDLINSTTNSTNGTYTLTISVSTDGVYNLTATAYDLTNNSNSTTNANITIDTTKPNVNIINSSFNTTDPTPSIYFNFTDSLSPNASCVLYFNNSAVGNSTAQNNTNTVITVNATTADGAYNVYVRCMDLAGNFNQSENITVTIDTLPPEVSLIYPVNNTLSSDASILLNWSVDNAGISIDKVWYLLDNKITKHFLSGGATNSTLVNFTAGTHTLILKANDTLNNIGASGEITFTVNIPVNATEIINNLINAAGNNLLLDASISNSSGGDQSNNANLTINQTLSMTMKINSSGTNATVTIPEFNGLKANWNETFDIRVNISSSIANNIINSSGTNVTKLFVFVNSGDFLDNKDYLNGSTITVYYNLTEDLDVLYINDDFGLQVYKLSYCNQIPTGKVNYPPAS